MVEILVGLFLQQFKKFSPEDEEVDGPLTTRSNVIVLADEAHRSQYGFSAKVVKTDKEGI